MSYLYRPINWGQHNHNWIRYWIKNCSVALLSFLWQTSNRIIQSLGSQEVSCILSVHYHCKERCAMPVRPAAATAVRSESPETHIGFWSPVTRLGSLPWDMQNFQMLSETFKLRKSSPSVLIAVHVLFFHVNLEIPEKVAAMVRLSTNLFETSFHSDTWREHLYEKGMVFLSTTGMSCTFFSWTTLLTLRKSYETRKTWTSVNII